jgi:hypothetical protein
LFRSASLQSIGVSPARRGSVGDLEDCVREAQVFRDEACRRRASTSFLCRADGSNTLSWLSSLNSLFHDLVDEFHEQIVPGFAI